jgi:protoporphyrinogen/coproporphyrinogen III oxidase
MLHTRTQVAIIGGGITGLACAHRLTELGVDSVVLESSAHPGGKIGTVHHNGYEFEPGPNTLIANKQPMLDLIREAGLGHDIIEGSAIAKRRYICLDGTLEPIPTSPLGTLKSPLLGPLTIARALRDAIPTRAEPPPDDESVADFITRRFGRRILDNLVAPFLTGIYAGDAARLEARAILSTLVEAEESTGSVIRGMVARRRAARKDGTLLPMRTITFKHGLAALPTRLARLLGDRVRTGANVARVETEGRACTIRTDAGEAITADRVVIATSPHAAALLLARVPGAQAVSAGLAGIQCASLAVVGLGYDRSAIDHPLDGFGYLRGPGTPGPVLGCLFRSSVFPHAAPARKALLTAFIGGVPFPDAVRESDERVAAIAHEELARRLGVRARPEEVFVRKWVNAIPQLNRGYSDLRHTVSSWSAHNPVSVVGSAITGLSLNDCAGAGRDEAERLQRALQFSTSPAPGDPAAGLKEDLRFVQSAIEKEELCHSA